MLELLGNEPVIRFGFFAGVFVVMAIWERVAQKRPQQISRLLRWRSNLGIAAINALLVRLSLPIMAVGLALLTEERGWGLLNLFEIPAVLVLMLSLLIFDLSIYFQHVIFHAVPTLWRLHRVHHADLEFDVTTGLRFHPLEILLSMGIKLLVVGAFGPPASAVVIFEIMLNITSMFNHSNVSLPCGLQCILRWLVVTPDMHRVHHSIRSKEMHSNFGFNLPWWDRLLGTYRAEPAQGHKGMTIGIKSFRTPQDLRLHRMLIQPMLALPEEDSTDQKDNQN